MIIFHEEKIFEDHIFYSDVIYIPRCEPYHLIAEVIKTFRDTGQPILDEGYTFPLESRPSSRYELRLIQDSNENVLYIKLYDNGKRILELLYDGEILIGKPKELVEKVEEWLEY